MQTLFKNKAAYSPANPAAAAAAAGLLATKCRDNHQVIRICKQTTKPVKYNFRVRAKLKSV